MASESDTTNPSKSSASETAGRSTHPGCGSGALAWFNVGPLATTAVVMSAYAGLGEIASILVPSADSASPIFPAAGFALAVTLITRRAALPGIVLGALLFNILVVLQTKGRVGPAEILVAGALCVGPVLQAATGAAALRRAIGYPAALDDARSVLTFVLSAPVICLISASLSMGVLVSFGLIEGPLALQNWVRWWLGDSIGVLVMLPLTMIVLGEPRQLWRSRARPVGAPLIVAMLLFIVLYNSAVSWSRTEAMRDIALRMEKVVEEFAADYRGLLATRLTDIAADTTLYNDFVADASPIAVQTLSFGGRQYHFENALSAAYQPADRYWEPWIVLSVGTYSFGLFSAFLLLASGYTARVTARVAEHTRELTNAQGFLRQVIDCLPNPLFIKDASHRFVAVNDAGCAMFGRSREELLGRDDYELFPPEEGAVFREKDDLVLGSGEINENEEQVTDADGNQRWILTRKATFENPDGQFLVGVITDLTARRKAELAVQSLALEDALTSLPNRRLLQQLLSNAQATAARTSSSIALLLIDLDQFKRINDTMGHSFGDELLVEVARRLREVMRADDVVGRLGGDEFAVIARTSLDPSTLGNLAQRIVGTLSLPFTIYDVEVRCGASVGVAISEPSCDDGSEAVTFDSLLARADLALYAAKEAGRNAWRFFEPVMHERACAQLTIERELRDAIRQQQLALQYQPIIRTTDLRLCGFEALIRWHHPQRNLVLPGEFIPMAERNRQIIPITFWTLSEAIRQLAQWRTAGISNIRVSVNLSTPAFAAEGLLAHVLDSLERNQVPGSALVVEVTEGALADHGRTVDVLEALRANGVQVAIDDFGAGYSSLGRLSEMPVDILKIDRSFLDGGERSETILRAMTQLARNLGLATVVEGVETERQFNIVRDAQADSVQGFGLCRPIPAENVPEWCARLDPQNRLIAPSLTTRPAA